MSSHGIVFWSGRLHSNPNGTCHKWSQIIATMQQISSLHRSLKNMIKIIILPRCSDERTQEIATMHCDSQLIEAASPVQVF
ncbi:hypothetical protein [uncultured Tateyamaria sp.]|uniref:hypothetical protein n=1 Tax=uncultured Tateyamaria sp. TaxID=455651 RepID=UPI002634BA4B|nr:hypothetical protein [uncultured Tateyamaria sp.]